MPIAFSRHSLALLLASVAAVPACIPRAFADASDRRSYDLPAQPLGASLRAIAAASGRNIVAQSVIVDAVDAPALKGSYTVDEAVTALLAGTDLRVRNVGSGLVVERRSASGEDDRSGPDIIVSGTRIRGAPVASPVITLGRERIKDSGLASLPDALKTVPQNFGGGQNPGLGNNVPEGKGADVGGGASINLRGLGSDATLTLLDGHRLSYNAAKESVDISVIPLGAVSRIDIVPDGASALFGSDAVAGVANVILRRDLNGLETSVRLGAATDGGGDFTQLYAITGGKTWGGGNVMVAYEYGSNTTIVSNQRDYAAIRPNVSLIPAQRRHDVLVTMRQEIVPGLTFALDGLFNKRWSERTYPRNAAGDLSISHTRSYSVDQSYGLAPSLTFAPSAAWEVSLSGSLGQDKVDYLADSYTGAAKATSAGWYRNRERSVELSGNGPVFELPGGSAKIALGAGYRRIDFVRFAGLANTQNIERSKISSYAFAEASLPIVKGVVVSAAGRYESYRGIGQVVTPKFGAILSPTPDVSVKASWGKSFRAPTLYEQYQPQGVYLLAISSLGGTGYPAGTTGLLLIGGNPNVTPEKSTNWSATLDLHPRALAGLRVEASYFSVHYRDRIIIPLPSFGVALATPLYASRVQTGPSAAQQSALIASVPTFLNLSGGTYDPAKTVVIVDDSNVNAGFVKARGIDLLIGYAGKLGGGNVTAVLDGSYLDSKQQIGPGQPITQLAGIIFNPPNYRLRGDVGWSTGAVTLTASVTYMDGVDDNRAATVARIDGMTPVDFTLRYAPTSGLLRGLDVIASLQNMFNAKPSRIATSVYFDSAYDSTNYSPVGRFVSLSVAKKW